MSRTLSVVIPVLDAQETLEGLLLALQEQRLPPGVSREIIVVDNGSRDRSPSIAQRFGARLLFCPRRGPSAARNEGIRGAGGEWISFLDADARPLNRELAANVLEMFALHPDAGAVGGPILPDPKGSTAAGVAEHMVAFFHWHSRRPRGISPVFQPTCNLHVRRETLDEVGGFREDLRNMEDLEWCDRLRGSGRWRIYYEPEAAVYHATRFPIRRAMDHIFGYGLIHREVYLEMRPNYPCPFRDHPTLFLPNALLLGVRHGRLVLGQWLRADPRGCGTRLPWVLFFLAVWALGVAVGANRFLRGRPEAG